MLKKLLAIIILFVTVLTFTACGSKEIEVTIDNDGGYGVTTLVAKKGEKLAEPIDPYKKGYVFTGWEANGKPYDFSKEVKESITLKATYEELDPKYLEELGLDEFENEDVAYVIAEALQKYDIDMDEIESVEDPIAYIEGLNDEELENLLSLAYTVIAARMYESGDQSWLDEMYDVENVQNIYDDFKTTIGYKSSSTKYADDKLFCEVIIPGVLAPRAYMYSREVKAFEILMAGFEQGYYAGLEVSRDKENITFKKGDLSYTVTLDEIEEIASWFYKAIENGTNGDVVDYYLAQKIKNSKVYKNIEELVIGINTIVKVSAEYATEKAKDILEAYNIINGYQAKIEDLTEEFASVQSAEDAKAVAKKVLEFKDQVISELKFVLPSKEDVEKLQPVLSALMQFVVGVNGSVGVSVAANAYNIILTELELFIDTANALVEVLEDINYKNYNIDAMIDFFLDGDTAKKEQVKKDVEKLVGSVYDKLDKLNTESAIESLEGTMPYDYESMLKVFFGSSFDEKKLEELTELLGLDKDLLTKDEVIKCALFAVFAVYEEKTKADVDEIVNIVVSKIEDMKVDKAVDLVKPYAKDFINTFLDGEGIEVVDLIDEHNVIIKEWAKIIAYCGIYGEVADMILLDGAIIIDQLEYIYKNFSQAEVDKLLALMDDLVAEGVMEADEEIKEVLADDYLAKVKKVIDEYKATGSPIAYLEAYRLGEVFAIQNDINIIE